MSLQLVNTHHPTSINNTFVFSVFEAKDNTTNLVALERYTAQVETANTVLEVYTYTIHEYARAT